MKTTLNHFFLSPMRDEFLKAPKLKTQTGIYGNRTCWQLVLMGRGCRRQRPLADPGDVSLVLAVGKCLICRRRWCEISIHQFIHYNEIMSHLYAPHRPQPPASATAPATARKLAFLGCGVAENHRTIKIIIKGHAAAAACYAKCPNGIVSHGGWLPRGVMGDGWRMRGEGASNLNFICWLPFTCPSIEGRLIKCLWARAAAGGNRQEESWRKTPRCVKRRSTELHDAGEGAGVADHLIYIISLLPAVNVLIRLILLRPPDVHSAWVSPQRKSKG